MVLCEEIERWVGFFKLTEIERVIHGERRVGQELILLAKG